MDGILSLVLTGFGTVFFGLICLIFIITVMGKILAPREKETAAVPAPGGDGELVAVITAALSQELGDGASNIEIRSIKKLNQG